MFLKLFWIQFKVKEQEKQNSQSWVFVVAFAQEAKKDL